jgi:ribosomal protein L37E
MATASDQTGPSEAPLHLPAIPADIYCTRCAYNLFGCVSDRCPECGRSLANLRSPESRIPWVHRRRIGRLRAYWQTVWMVTFGGQGLYDEYSRPLRISDARAFQWVTLSLVLAAAISVVVALYHVCPPCVEMPDFFEAMVFPGTVRVPTGWDRAYAEVWPVGVLLACFLLLLAAATTVPGHFFHPRGVSVERQNSGIALSLYACGPLAFLLLLVPILAGVCGAWSRGSRWMDEGAIASGVVLAIPPVLAAWWWNLVRQTRCTLPQFRYRSLAVAAVAPVIWLILTGVFLVALPAAILYVLVIISSLS